MASHDLFDLVLETIDEFSMLEDSKHNESRVLVLGVSGGPDSLALLHVLHRIFVEGKTKLVVAHINHNLRGAESDTDARVVEEYCHKLGLECHVFSVDVEARALASGESTEMAARHLRYECFTQLLGDVGAEVIALGHNRDDTAETVLINLIRGAGPHGLAGIPPVRQGLPGLPNARVVRPLIKVSRGDIERYCIQWNLPTRFDSSNLTSDYLRNRIRNELIPLLEETYNPGIKNSLHQLASVCRDENIVMDGIAQDKLACLATHTASSLNINTKLLRGEPKAIQRRIIRLALGTIGAPNAFHQVEASMKLTQGRGGSVLELGSGATIRLQGGFLELRSGSPPRVEQTEWAVPLNVPGVTLLPTGASIVAEWVNVKDLRQSFLTMKADSAIVDAATIDFGESMVVRSRKPGDRFVPFGRHKFIKVKDYLIDSKVAPEERSHIPIVESTNGICWLAGLRADERFKVRAETQRALRLALAKDNPDML